MRFDQPDWDRAVHVLGAADEVAIACHVNPDGDALGSLFAASIAFRQLGKKTYPTWGTTPAEIPVAYEFLPGASTLVQPADVPEAPVFLAVDCGAGDRLGELTTKAKASPEIVNIDHHPGNDSFGTLNIVVPSASSAAEIVTRLLQDLGVAIDRDIATCLYTGIVTDTGRFQYTNSSPETLRLAADLLEIGVPAADIALEVFESAPFGYLKLLGHVLERAKLQEEDGFVYSWLTLEDLAETGVAPAETDQLIDRLRSTRAAEVAAILKEQADGGWRVSMRSKGPRSVGAIGRAHGGGGHELAAGFTAPSLQEGIEAITAGLRAQAVAGR